MQLRLEKFDHHHGQHRYCVLNLYQTLFGDWCVERLSGPLGGAGGQQKRHYFPGYAEALVTLEIYRDRQVKRGFVPIPVQLGLF